MSCVKGDTAPVQNCDNSQADAPLTVLRGVGPKLAERLAAVGLTDLGALLRFFPRRHQEVLQLETADLAALDLAEPDPELEGRFVRLAGRVDNCRLNWLPGRRSMVTVTLSTEAGLPVAARFFNQPYLKNSYPAGRDYWVEGRLQIKPKLLQVLTPKLFAADKVQEGPCHLTYAEVPGVSEARLRSLIQQALAQVDLVSLVLQDLPPSLRHTFPGYAEALRAMHQPVDLQEYENARQRFALVEAVALFRRVERGRRQRQACHGPEISLDEALHTRIRSRLPFQLTAEQETAVAALIEQIRGPSPMGMMLQGDVGTGKTAVALYAALAALARGWQVAFLAPTELLAEQHHAGLKSWLQDSPVQPGLLTASQEPEERLALEEELRSGQPKLVFGTHALCSKNTVFARLGLVIIDEQHRFGVRQRLQLLHKGDNPHVLYMTATPIPRTLCLTLFGDLSQQILRQRPPGHRSAPALYLPGKQWSRAMHTMTQHLRRGGQVFVVCPKVGEDGSKGGAVHLHALLAKKFNCGLVHGQMKTVKRQKVLDDFRDGRVRLLVGTTVLEVGVDVPKATLMVVVGADRFGLATLHQLRGRVGRGQRRGLCLLVGKPGPRIRALCATTDGFALAEEDLRLRKAGELLGTKQSGLGDLRALDPLSDLDLLVQARKAVQEE